MPKTMKAAVVHKFGKPLTIDELPIPEPKAGQALVKIEASGVCHTDLHAADRDWPVKPAPPFVPGHEGAGIVAALGPGVTHLKEGDRVGIAWLHSACGHCEFCLSGWETLCLQQQNSGYSVNGSFAEYTLAADYLGRIPANLSSIEVVPILCAGVTTYKGLKETQARPGEWVVTTGVGGLGHVAVVNAFKQAVGMLRRGGTCMLYGLPAGEFPISIFDLVLNRYTVRGSIVGTRKNLEEALAFAADGKVKATIETQPLEAINKVFDRLKQGKVNGRIVLDIAHAAEKKGTSQVAAD